MIIQFQSLAAPLMPQNKRWEAEKYWSVDTYSGFLKGKLLREDQYVTHYGSTGSGFCTAQIGVARATGHDADTSQPLKCTAATTCKVQYVD